MRLDLPSGGWAEIRAVSEITERYRRPIAFALSQLSPEGIETMTKLEPYLTDGSKTKFDLEHIGELGIRFSAADLQHFSDANDYCIVALTTSWSFGTPITLETVLDLKGPDYDYLREACAPASASLFVDFTMSKESVENVDSPFAPSNGSSTSSPEDSSLTSTSPSTSGESIASSS